MRAISKPQVVCKLETELKPIQKDLDKIFNEVEDPIGNLGRILLLFSARTH